MLWFAALSVAWPCVPLAETWVGLPWGGARPDSIIVVANPKGFDLALHDANDAPVPVTTYVFGTTAVLDPVEDLVPETAYTVMSRGQPLRTFTPHMPQDYDTPTERAGPPVAVRFQLETGVVHPPLCGPAVGPDRALVELCGSGSLVLIAVGPERPAEATLADPGEAFVFSGYIDLVPVLGLGEGDAATLWFGAFDGAGRFSGWSDPEVLVMPPDQHIATSSRPRDPGRVPGTCRTGPWELDIQYCPPSERTCLDGYRPITGCATSSAPTHLHLVFLGLLLATTRRLAGSKRSCAVRLGSGAAPRSSL